MRKDYEINIDDSTYSLLDAIVRSNDDPLRLAALAEVDPDDFRQFLKECSEVESRDAIQLLKAAEAIKVSNTDETAKTPRIEDLRKRLQQLLESPEWESENNTVHLRDLHNQYLHSGLSSETVVAVTLVLSALRVANELQKSGGIRRGDSSDQGVDIATIVVLDKLAAFLTAHSGTPAKSPLDKFADQDAEVNTSPLSIESDSRARPQSVKRP